MGRTVLPLIRTTANLLIFRWFHIKKQPAESTEKHDSLQKPHDVWECHHANGNDDGNGSHPERYVSLHSTAYKAMAHRQKGEAESRCVSKE